MKKILFILICLLITNNIFGYGVNNNNTGAGTAEDSITVRILVTDTISNMALADSFVVVCFNPKGDSVFAASYIGSANQIDFILVGSRRFYRWTEAVATIDGAGVIGTYTGWLIAIDTLDGTSSDYLEVQIPLEFQLINSSYSELLDSIGVAAIAALQSLDSLDKVIDSLEQATLQRDENLDSIIVILDSVYAIKDSIDLYIDATISSRSILTSLDNIGINWGDVINPSTVVNLSATTTNLVNTATNVTSGVIVTTNNDKTNYTLSIQGIEDVVHGVWGHIVDTGWAPGTFGDSAKLWGATAASGGVSDAEMGSIADSVWQKAVRAITDKLGFALTDAQLGAIADSIWQRSIRELTALDEDNTTIDLDNTTIGAVITLTTNLDKNNYTLTTAEHGIIGDSTWNKNIEVGFADPSAGFLLRVLAKDLSDSVNDTSLFKQLKTIINVIESQRGKHSSQAMSNIFYVDPVNGDTHANGNRGGVDDPYNLVQDCHDNAILDSNHDIIFLVAGAALSPTTLLEDVTLTKRYTFVRGPGRDFIWSRIGNGNTINIAGDGIEVSGFQLETAATGVGHGIQITDADFVSVNRLWINATQGDGVNVLRGDNTQIFSNHFFETGQSGAGQGVHVVGTAGTSNNNSIFENDFRDCAGDGILIESGTTNNTSIKNNCFEGSIGYGVNIGGSSIDASVTDNRFGNNTSGSINDGGVTSVLINNEQWSTYNHLTDSVFLANRGEISKQIADSIIFYDITGSFPNGTLGKFLKTIGSSLIRVENSQGMWNGKPNQVILDVDASGTYDPSTIRNSLTGETHFVIEHDTITNIVTTFRDFKVPFEVGDEFVIESNPGLMVSNDGRVRGATANTVYLNPLADDTTNIYKNQAIYFSAGLGQDGVYKIKSYTVINGDSSFVTLYENMYTIPDTFTSYVIIPNVDGIESRIMDSLRGEPIPVVQSDTTITGKLVGLMPPDWTAADSIAFQGAGSSLTLEQIALIVDSILSANHGLGPWTTGGTGSGPNTVFIYTIDSSAVPNDTLTGIDVFVNNLTGTPEASGKTNSLGFTTVGLTFDTWDLLAGTNITNYSFDGIQFTNTTNPDTVSIFGYKSVIPDPIDPSKGLIFGFAKDVLGNPKDSVTVILSLEKTVNATSTSPGGYVVALGVDTVLTNILGFFEFEVPITSTYNDSTSLYQIKGLLNKTTQFIVGGIVVPDVGNVDITDKINNP